MAQLITLEEIQKQWVDDSKIDGNNLDQEAIKTAMLHGKYLEYFSLFKLQLRKFNNKYALLKKDKFLYYSGKMPKVELDKLGWDYDPFGGCSKPLKSDLNYWFDSDDDLIKQKDKIEYCETILKTIESIMSQIQWRHQHLKLILDSRKFVAGEF